MKTAQQVESRFYFYILRWEEIEPDEWDEVVVQRSTFAQTFDSAYQLAEKSLRSIKGGDYSAIAHIGRQVFDDEFLVFFSADNLEEMSIQIDELTEEVMVLNEGHNVLSTKKGTAQ